MDEPNRIERMVGEIVGLRFLVEMLFEKLGGTDIVQEELMQAIEKFEPRSDTIEGAERIKACAKNMLQNFPDPMDEKIV